MHFNVFKIQALHDAHEGLPQGGIRSETLDIGFPWARVWATALSSRRIGFPNTKTSRFLGDVPTNVGAFARSMRWMLSFSVSNASCSAREQSSRKKDPGPRATTPPPAPSGAPQRARRVPALLGSALPLLCCAVAFPLPLIFCACAVLCCAALRCVAFFALLFLALIGLCFALLCCALALL